MATKIQLRRDTAANWTSVNPTLSAGEEGLETDTSKRKVGDGTTAWNSLGYRLWGHVIEEEGTPLTQRGTINVVGAGATVTDAGGKTVLTIPGGGGYVGSQPADYGWSGWSFEPDFAGAASIPAAGELHVVEAKGTPGAAFTHAVLNVYGAGVTLTVGQNFAMVYNPDNQELLAQSADQETVWETAGTYEIPVAAFSGRSRVYPASGRLFVAFYSQGTTRPGFARSSNGGPGNGLRTGFACRFARVAGGYTTAPPDPLPALTAATGPMFFAAVK